MESCKLENLVGLYHDEELDFARRVEFERHLAGCAVCAAELNQLRRVTGVLAAVTIQEIKPDEQARMRAAIRRQDWRVGERAILRMAVPLAALAATVLIVTSTFLFANMGSRNGAMESVAPATPEFEQLAVRLPSDTRLPAWMVRSLGGDAP